MNHASFAQHHRSLRRRRLQRNMNRRVTGLGKLLGEVLCLPCPKCPKPGPCPGEPLLLPQMDQVSAGGQQAGGNHQAAPVTLSPVQTARGGATQTIATLAARSKVNEMVLPEIAKALDHVGIPAIQAIPVVARPVHVPTALPKQVIVERVTATAVPIKQRPAQGILDDDYIEPMLPIDSPEYPTAADMLPGFPEYDLYRDPSNQMVVFDGPKSMAQRIVEGGPRLDLLSASKRAVTPAIDFHINPPGQIAPPEQFQINPPAQIPQSLINPMIISRPASPTAPVPVPSVSSHDRPMNVQVLPVGQPDPCEQTVRDFLKRTGCENYLQDFPQYNQTLSGMGQVAEAESIGTIIGAGLAVLALGWGASKMIGSDRTGLFVKRVR